MKRYIQHRSTGRFLNSVGDWAESAAHAKTFHSKLEAVGEVEFLRLRDVDFVMIGRPKEGGKRGVQAREPLA